jgi:multiple antibiotic resistance protein
VTLSEYLLLAFTSLFVIVDPIAVVPAFLAMTPDDTAEKRARTALVASLVAASILMGFALGGPGLLGVLGITMPAFQIAGSILLLLVALDMLRARTSPVRETRAETAAGAEKEDVAVSPLAVPMLAGPGALTTVLLLRSRASGEVQHVLLYAVIAFVCLLTYLILLAAARHASRVPPIAMRVATRLMGLLLSAVAVQFFLDGLKASGVTRG